MKKTNNQYRIHFKKSTTNVKNVSNSEMIKFGFFGFDHSSSIGRTTGMTKPKPTITLPGHNRTSDF